MFAEIVILKHIGRASEEGRAFHYDVPDALRDAIAPGHLVVVPLLDRRLPGIVVALSDVSPVQKTRPIETLLDPAPVLSPIQLEVAQWISRSTLAPLYECIDLFVPAGLAGRVDALYGLAVEAVPEKMTATQAEVFALLHRRGPLRGAQIDRALPRKDWRGAVRTLVRRGVVSRRSVLLPPTARPKTARFARLIADPRTFDAQRLSARADAASRRAAVLHLLAGAHEPVQLSHVYESTHCNWTDLERLAEQEWISLSEEEVWRDPLAGKEFVPVEPPALTDDQNAAWGPIEKAIRQATPEIFLLHGVTGSGKTEIYLRAAGEVLRSGRQAIVLVPEIALTPQTVRRFAARFPGRVGVLHSELGDGERYDLWRRARLGAVDILIGPRSALFAPLPRLGLIVVDEEHDASYKQEHRPYYHAREVALQLAKLSRAVVLLGSATPALESYVRARRGDYRLLALPRRVLGHVRRVRDQEERLGTTSRFEAASGDALYRALPPVEIVDLRAELKAGNAHMFSRRLQAGLKETLSRGEQAILFLNRRGLATFVSCRDCGHVLKCPRCDTPLTYHDSSHQPIRPLMCHTCNHREPQPAKCPACGSTRIRYFGAGTQTVEAAVREMFPDARVLRWDRDATQGKAAHEGLLQRFVDGQADVLVGTQMIAKGLDLPLVTLVGVVSADMTLNLPDFRSAERTFQVLTQVAGRAGRGLRGGRAIVQTYSPDHYAVDAASHHAYESFVEHELAFRGEHRYPPHVRLARLIVRDGDAGKARRSAEKVAAELDGYLTRRGPGRESILGLAPCFFARVAGLYRWHILVRAEDPAALLSDFPLPANWRIDIDPLNML